MIYIQQLMNWTRRRVSAAKRRLNAAVAAFGNLWRCVLANVVSPVCAWVRGRATKIAQHVCSNFLKTLRATLLIASIMFILDHMVHAMETLNDGFMAAALHLRLSTQLLPGTQPRPPDKPPVLALIDACAFQNDFARTTPLDRRKLAEVVRRLQPPMAAGVPAVLVVDIDVAPTPTLQAMADPEGQRELEDALGGLVVAGTKLVLAEPTERTAPLDVLLGLKCWRTCFKDTACREGHLADLDPGGVCAQVLRDGKHHDGDDSVRFASPNVQTRNGFILHQSACAKPRLPREHPLESLGQAGFEFVRAPGKGLHGGAASPCGEKEGEGHGEAGGYSLATPWATDYVSRQERPPPPRICAPDSETLILRDEKGVVPPGGVAGRVVFLGMDSPETDQHNVLMANGRQIYLSGVVLHAANYAAIAAPVSEAAALSFLLDIAVGLFSGLLLSFAWPQRTKHLLAAFSHPDPRSWRQLVLGAAVRDPEAYLKSTYWWVWNVLLLAISLFGGVCASAWGLGQGYWVSGAPVVLGIYLHSLLESREALLERAIPHHHADGHAPDTIWHRVQEHIAQVIWAVVRGAQLVPVGVVALFLLWPSLFEHHS